MSLTSKGRAAFQRYLDTLRGIIEHGAEAGGQTKKGKKR